MPDSCKRRLGSSVSALGIALMVGPAFANPEGGTVTAGSATISSPAANLLQINQASQRAIIDWKRFDIAPGETTRFVQPDLEAWTLNRVGPTGDPSRILGTLEANGNIVIVNPDGVHFGPGARVDVNRLIATTANINNDNFLAGRMIFDQPGNPSASIVNEGTISIREHGLAALVAPGVRNSGVIAARLGTVSLSAGNRFTIDPYGDGLVKLAIGDEIADEVYDAATGEPMDDLVDNAGTVKADGGTVMMSATTARRAVNSVINNTGVIEANSVGMHGGKIVLGAQTAGTKTAAAPVQRVRVSGQVRAVARIPDEQLPVPSPAPRGRIEITGESIVAENAEIDASGSAGGGTILIGGDYLGGNADPTLLARYGIALEEYAIPTAAYTFLGPDVTVRADALQQGDGGKIIVWSDVATRTAAAISARGGPAGGDGGFVETSGAYLDVQRAADASARNGQAGTWLLDPIDITIKRAPQQNVTTAFVANPAGPFEVGIPSGSPSVINVANIETALNAGTNVFVTNRGSVGSERGNVTIEDSIYKTAGGDVQAIIDAANDVRFSPGVELVSTSGAVHLSIFAEDDISGSRLGRVELNGGNLVLRAGDDIRFKTGSDLPPLVTLSLANSGKGTSTGRVDVQFDDDIVNFTYNERDAVFRTDAVVLKDRSGPNGVTLAFDEPVTGELYDLAIAVDVNNGKFFNNGLRAVGVNPDARLNGVPELVTNGTPSEFAAELADILARGGQPIVNWFDFHAGGGLASVGEVATSFDQKVDFYVVTDRSGREAVVRHLAPPIPQLVANPSRDDRFSPQGVEPLLAKRPVQYVNNESSSENPDAPTNRTDVVFDQELDELIGIYDGDIIRMTKVAENADYALLARAAYFRDPDTRYRDEGWSAGPVYYDYGFLSGEATATLFERRNPTSEEIEYVLAFQGTVSAQNAVTTLASLGNFETAHTNFASRLARQIVNLHPNVVFVGHSMGGRMAKVASMETGNRSVSFNTAPLSFEEATQIIRDPIDHTEFRSPVDVVSILSSQSAWEVSNVKRADADIFRDSAWEILRSANQHEMGALADAMLAVKRATNKSTQ